MRNIGLLNIKNFTRAVLICSTMSLLSCSDNPTVEMVKNGSLESCESKTLGEMVEGFMGSPSWSSGVTQENQEFVDVDGTIMFADKEVEASLQFLVNSETFEYNALEFNGVPQNNFVAMGLLNKMCE